MLSLKQIILGSYISGCQILWLIFAFQIILLIQLIIKLITHLRYSSEWNKKIIVYISVPLFFVLCYVVPIYLLWKGIKQCSKKVLRSYVLVKSVLFPSFWGFIIIIKSYTSWMQNIPSKSFDKAAGIVTQVITIALEIYGMYVVYICYKKLESPIIAHLYDHCHKLREVQSAELEHSDPAKKLDDIDDKKEESVTVNCDSYQLESFILNPLDVAIDNGTVLGEGAFGIVYKGIFHHKKKKVEIAAKVAKDTQSSETIEMILQEIKILIHVGNHDNIITFYGVTSDASIDNHLALITEYVSLGCLEDFLKEKRHTFKDLTRESGLEVYADKSLVYINLDDFGTHSTIDLIRLSVDIAKGMDHLASKKIVHGDLASRNVLLTKDLHAKLTDFGMSRRLYAYQIYSAMQKQKGLLPWRWMSVEAIEDLNLSEKSDVWSFGVTLWEIFTLGDFPFKDVEWSLEIPKQLRQGLMKLKRPRYATFKLYNIMAECWSIELNKRPNFHDLSNRLEEILQMTEIGTHQNHNVVNI